ncbi:MAG: iron-containing alcohol dehydrogenase [Eubacterium sp.]|nr:iron-containing alcohol dehydrogenase [Eubacterium sp.]
MNNFNYTIPTKVHFGKGQIAHLSEMKEYGSKVLLVYGGGSIKKSGLYDTVLSLMKECGIEVFELSGVEPNPHIDTVRRGTDTCKKEGIDMVLAVGGGSTIDCAKVVAAAACYAGDAWELVTDAAKIDKTLPIFTVLTLSATGSEMDRVAVISDPFIPDKVGTHADGLFPTMSVLDPTYTYSVPPRQTAAGTADMMSHTMENYFTNATGTDVQAGFCESILKTCIKYGPIALAHPDDYDARANLMWCGSLAINGILSYGAEVKWCVHPIEHELSAYYDVTHGEGLAVLTPVWMEYVLEHYAPAREKLAQFGRNVWGIPGQDDEQTAKMAIEKLKEFFFDTLKMPKNLRELGIDDKSKLDAMAEHAAKGCNYAYMDLTKEDVKVILERAF